MRPSCSASSSIPSGEQACPGRYGRTTKEGLPMTLQGPILVPLDGSALAERAVPVAAQLARASGAELQLVHVHDPMASDPIHIAGLPIIDDRDRAVVEPKPTGIGARMNSACPRRAAAGS